MPKQDEVQISDLEARCNFSRYWASTDDTWVCRQPATSMVVVPDAPRQGKPKFRCNKHEGMLSLDERGTVVTAMPKELAVGWLSKPLTLVEGSKDSSKPRGADTFGHGREAD